MNKKLLIVCIILVMSLGLLSGCTGIRDVGAHEFENGCVMVEYTQYSQMGTNDILKFTFNEIGNYTFYFEPALEIGNNIVYHIDSFQIRIISQHILPDKLTITYLREDNNKEIYTFK